MRPWVRVSNFNRQLDYDYSPRTFLPVDKPALQTYYSSTMASESVQRRIENLLNAANEAVAESNWAVVRNRAENVLRIDPVNEDALAFMATAERRLGLFTFHPENQIP